jgi:hypothetical protein
MQMTTVKYTYKDCMDIIVHVEKDVPKKLALEAKVPFSNEMVEVILSDFRAVFPEEDEEVNEMINPYGILTRGTLNLGTQSAPYFIGHYDVNSLLRYGSFVLEEEGAYTGRLSRKSPTTCFGGKIYPATGMSPYFTIVDALNILAAQGVLHTENPIPIHHEEENDLTFIS